MARLTAPAPRSASPDEWEVLEFYLDHWTCRLTARNRRTNERREHQADGRPDADFDAKYAAMRARWQAVRDEHQSLAIESLAGLQSRCHRSGKPFGGRAVLEACLKRLAGPSATVEEATKPVRREL